MLRGPGENALIFRGDGVSKERQFQTADLARQEQEIVAVAGKGGSGKTTMAGLLIKYLVRENKTPILAVDADCNANLNEVLGLEIKDTLGNAREEMKKGVVPGGMTKDIFMEMLSR